MCVCVFVCVCVYGLNFQNKWQTFKHTYTAEAQTQAKNSQELPNQTNQTYHAPQRIALTLLRAILDTHGHRALPALAHLRCSVGIRHAVVVEAAAAGVVGDGHGRRARGVDAVAQACSGALRGGIACLVESGWSDGALGRAAGVQQRVLKGVMIAKK